MKHFFLCCPLLLTAPNPPIVCLAQRYFVIPGTELNVIVKTTECRCPVVPHPHPPPPTPPVAGDCGVLQDLLRGRQTAVPRPRLVEEHCILWSPVRRLGSTLLALHTPPPKPKESLHTKTKNASCFLKEGVPFLFYFS